MPKPLIILLNSLCLCKCGISRNRPHIGENIRLGWIKQWGGTVVFIECIVYLYSKCIEGSSHYLGDKQDFDVSSKGPSSGN